LLEASRAEGPSASAHLERGRHGWKAEQNRK
jgi:hypothetical protein